MKDAEFVGFPEPPNVHLVEQFFLQNHCFNIKVLFHYKSGHHCTSSLLKCHLWATKLLLHRHSFTTIAICILEKQILNSKSQHTSFLQPSISRGRMSLQSISGSAGSKCAFMWSCGHVACGMYQKIRLTCHMTCDLGSVGVKGTISHVTYDR